MRNAFEFDKAMRVPEPELQGMEWISAFDKRVNLCGLAWNTDKQRFRRLPENDKGDIPEAVDHLAENTSGAQIRFATTSKRIAVSVELAGPSGMYHMPATGQCGCDIYIKQNERFLFYYIAKFARDADTYNALVFEHEEDGEREFIINLPLYQGVKSFHIGIEDGSSIKPVVDYKKRIVVYGTSITQGGCATRPGMSCSNILSRSIHCEFFNLGFSGNGRGEPALAEYICQIENPDLIVLDYEANTGAVGIGKTMAEFVHILRETHPALPILVVSKPPFVHDLVQAKGRERTDSEREWQRNFVEDRQASGDDNIYFLDGSGPIEEAFIEGTVDGVHPTDIGFQLMADHWEPVLRDLLNI